MYDCRSLPRSSNKTELLKQLTMLLDPLESTETFSAFLSYAAKYMVAVGVILKSMYPELFPVACFAYLLHNFAVKVTLKMLNG